MFIPTPTPIRKTPLKLTAGCSFSVEKNANKQAPTIIRNQLRVIPLLFSIVFETFPTSKPPVIVNYIQLTYKGFDGHIEKLIYYPEGTCRSDLQCGQNSLKSFNFINQHPSFEFTINDILHINININIPILSTYSKLSLFY